MIKSFSIIIILIYSNIIISQNTLTFKSIKNSSLTTPQKIVKMDSLLELNNNNKDILFNYLKLYSKWLYKKKLYDKSIIISNKSLKIALLIENPQIIQKSLFTLGYYYRKNKQIYKSIDLFNKCLEVSNQNIIAANTYFQLGLVYKELNDYIISIKNYELAIILFKEFNKYSQLRDTYYNISDLFIMNDDKNRLLKGIYYCKKADSISRKFPTKLYKKYLIKLLLASLYNQNKTLDINTARINYIEALKIAEVQNNLSNINRINIYLGNLYNTTNYEMSLKYLNKISIKQIKNNKKQLSNLYFNFALTYSYGKKFDKSIECYDKAIYALTEIKDIEFNDNSEGLINNPNKIKLLHYFNNLAKTYLQYFKINNKNEFLNKSILYFKLSDKLIDLLKIDNRSFKSRLFWRETSNNLYNLAVKASYLNNNINDALFFMEKNKALLLAEDIAMRNYKLTIDVPKKLLDKEINYKKQLSAINQISNLNSNDSLLKSKVDLQRELYTFQNSIYKGKNNRNIESKISTVTDIQNNLNENEVFISYHVSKDDDFGVYINNDNGYALFITKKNKFLFEINNLSQFNNDFTILLNRIKTPFITKDDKTNFNNLSYKVFNKLFPSKKIKDLIKNKKLIIAPDSYLSLLPFETLITQINYINKPVYLIKTCDISYIYSYSFLKNNISKKQENLSFVVIAPITFKDTNLSTLINSEKEILNLNNYFKGEIFTNSKATKDVFLEQLPKHNIIHLATHANAQDSIPPWIAFNKEKITLPELYLTKNKASLIVISGCNTNLGKQERGEGVMSLARGFFYGGAQSVVSSLWPVDDKSTPYIMNEFYKNLYNGQTKSKSLRNAKLTYLENHSLSELSPHYWASFILLGKDNSVLHSSTNWSPFFIGFFLLSVLIFLFIKRNNFFG